MATDPTSRRLGALLTLVIAACGGDANRSDDVALDTLPELDVPDVLLDVVPELDVAPDTVPDATSDISDTPATPPTFANLPGEAQTAVHAAGSFTVVTEPPDVAVTATTDCPFDVALTDTTLSWTCPATSTTCPILVTIGAGETRSEATLTVRCDNGVPRFDSALPIAATEGLTFDYAPRCVDPEGATLALAVGPDDDCGGVIADGRYTFTPGELEGGTRCAAQITCRDAEWTATQAGFVDIAEANSAPALVLGTTTIDAVVGTPTGVPVTTNAWRMSLPRLCTRTSMSAPRRSTKNVVSVVASSSHKK